MPKASRLEIASDGLGLHVEHDSGRHSLPLKHLVPGSHLLAHPDTTIVALDGPHQVLALSDGAHFQLGQAVLARGSSQDERPEVDLLVTNIGQLLSLDEEDDAPLCAPLATSSGAALAARSGRVVSLGLETDVRASVRLGPHTLLLDAGGRLVSPGLVDPHTHPAFAGDRAAEFALRARGASYQDIAGQGGGIWSTVRATREATDSNLLTSTARHITSLIAHGVTTAEAKSGYDLTLEGEMRLLGVLRHLDKVLPVDLSTTLLGAHVVAPEYVTDRDGYVALVAEEMVPRAAREGLADSVDVYCDEGAFTREESRRILEAARAEGLATRIHAGQFADLGGAGLAAGLGAVSADHLEAISAEDRALMATGATVAVILPGAALTLRCPWPDVGALREAGVRIALGTDLNPGTSHTAHLPLMMSLGCMQLGMTVEEAWRAVTTVAARAALRPDAGVLRPGGPADLVIWDCSHYAALPYRLGANLARTVIKAGLVAVDRGGAA